MKETINANVAPPGARVSMQGEHYMQLVAQQLKASRNARHSASKYDFVKVWVLAWQLLAIGLSSCSASPCILHQQHRCTLTLHALTWE
jgi:hypothetical protein